MNVAGAVMRNIQMARFNACKHERWGLYKNARPLSTERWECRGCGVIASSEGLLQLLSVEKKGKFK